MLFSFFWFLLLLYDFFVLPGQHNSHSIIEYTLPKHERVEVNIDVKVVENGENSDRVRRRHYRSEEQTLREMHGEVREDQGHGVHNTPDDEGRYAGACERKGHDGAKVTEKVSALHTVTRVEDDRRE